MKWDDMLQIQREKIFVCLVGLPGSGKSTFCKKNLGGYTIVSTDDIIEEAAQKAGKTYNEVFKDVIGDADKLARATFRQAIAEQVPRIAWDQTNVSAKKRMGILAQIPPDYHKIAVHFDVSLDILKERLVAREQQTGKRIALAIVEDMMARFEAPTIAEGFNEILLV